MSGLIKRQNLPEIDRSRKASRIAGEARPASFAVLLSLLSNVFNAPLCMIDLTEFDAGWFEFEATRGPVPIPETLRLSRMLAHRSDSLIIMDTVQDPRFHAAPGTVDMSVIRFFAAVAVHEPGSRAFGRLCVMDYRPRYFSDHDLKKLEQFAEIANGILVTARKQRTAFAFL